MEKRLVTTKEAARFLGVSPAFLERDRWRGARIPSSRSARALSVTSSQLSKRISPSRIGGLRACTEQVRTRREHLRGRGRRSYAIPHGLPTKAGPNHQGRPRGGNPRATSGGVSTVAPFGRDFRMADSRHIERMVRAPVHCPMSRGRCRRGMDELAAYHCHADWPAWLISIQPNLRADAGKYRGCG